MNVRTAAVMTRGIIPEGVVPERRKDGRGVAHAAALLDAIVVGGYKNDPQANRWLAWAQCLLNGEGVATLDDLKAINKAA